MIRSNSVIRKLPQIACRFASRSIPNDPLYDDLPGSDLSRDHELQNKSAQLAELKKQIRDFRKIEEMIKRKNSYFRAEADQIDQILKIEHIAASNDLELDIVQKIVCKSPELEEKYAFTDAVVQYPFHSGEARRFSKAKNKRFANFHKAVYDEKIVAICERPSFETMKNFSSSINSKFNFTKPLGNIRVLVENLKHSQNIISVMNSCNHFGVNSVHLTESSTDCFSPDILAETNCGFLSLPIEENCKVEEKNWFEGDFAPFFVLMEKSADAFEDDELVAISHFGIDWSYPNIILVFGQESAGISKSFYEKIRKYKPVVGVIETSLDLPLSLSSSVAITVSEAFRQNSTFE